MEKKTKFSIWYIIAAMWGVILLHDLFTDQYRPVNIPYSSFIKALDEGRVREVVITQDRVAGKLNESEGGQEKVVNFVTFRVDPELSNQLAKHNIPFRQQPENTFIRDLLSWILPALFFVGIWYLIIGRMRPGQGVMSFGKSKAKLYAEKEIKTRFED
ncbi:MAG: ATP-dependent metallopeptidase FtsH/Yme1/Tma family protein, partial [Syntrophobacteraceae bacterium]